VEAADVCDFQLMIINRCLSGAGCEAEGKQEPAQVVTESRQVWKWRYRGRHLYCRAATDWKKFNGL